MISETQKKIDYAISYLRAIELETIPETYMTDLLNAIRTIDDKYKEECFCIDDEHGEEEGTTYRTGYSAELYIEADDWHVISQLLKKIEADLNKKKESE